MISTANLLEVQQIINCTHGDPHHILGMHEIQLSGKDALAVRVFLPQANKLTLLDPSDKDISYEFEKIHVDGFFELIIKNRTKWFRYLLQAEGFNDEVWEFYDPYSFAPLIYSMDLHLFGEGTHYQIFEKLGAHPMTVEGIKGVLFGVWAPNAKRISVIGDFNSWDGRRNPMRVLGNSGVWEIFIPGLQNCDNYKYEIKSITGQLLQKTDPYGNFAELRPSTSSLIYDLTKYNWRDKEWLEHRAENDPLKGPINIYEVHLGSWKRKVEDNDRFLSYVELSDTLIPYVKEMGYTHIELMGISEHPFDGSWGYQVTGYYAPTSRHGNPEEFMYFIDECHKNNIGVILDWVPAHFPKDAHGLAKFDGTSLYEHEDPRKGEHPEWGTLIFNYGRGEVKNFLIANAIFWLEKYHVDGLRVDAVASMLYLDYGKNEGNWVKNQYGGRENYEAVEFMKHMNSVIIGKNPNVLMIAEESTSWAGVSKSTEKGGLGYNLKWNMGWMNDFLSYLSRDTIYRKFHHNNLTFSMVYAYTENFVLVLSHDEVVHGKGSLINKMPGDMWQKLANLRAAYGFMYGHPGKKLLFMGGEFAQSREWSEERSLDWHLLQYDDHKNMQQYVKDLNEIYRNEKSLWLNDFNEKGFEWINCCDSNRSVVSFIRKGVGDDITIFVCNFTPNPIFEHTIGVPQDCEYVEILNSDNTKYGGSGIVNEHILRAEAVAWDNSDFSINLKVPPLGVTILKPLKN